MKQALLVDLNIWSKRFGAEMLASMHISIHIIKFLKFVYFSLALYPSVTLAPILLSIFVDSITSTNAKYYLYYKANGYALTSSHWNKSCQAIDFEMIKINGWETGRNIYFFGEDAEKTEKDFQNGKFFFHYVFLFHLIWFLAY